LYVLHPRGCDDDDDDDDDGNTNDIDEDVSSK